MARLLQDLVINSAWKTPHDMAFRLIDHALDSRLDYAQLAQGMQAAGQALLSLGVQRGERVAVLLDKREEALLAMFGALAAGAAFVPIDPMQGAEPVAAILRDSRARVLVTTPRRRTALAPQLACCPALRCVLQTGGSGAAVPGLAVFGWNECLKEGAGLTCARVDESDTAALIYQRGTSGRQKAMALSHRSLLDYAAKLGARLGAGAQRRSLALLPLSDPCGLGLLASTLGAHGESLALNHVLAREIPALVAREAVTSMTAQPWLWMQVAALNWRSDGALQSITSKGGTLPRPTLEALRRRLPLARVYLMHLRQADAGAVLPDHPGVEARAHALA
jgi:acyl-CoA synthetase (AMP-forming)/AMP-acid ligase II